MRYSQRDLFVILIVGSIATAAFVRAETGPKVRAERPDRGSAREDRIEELLAMPPAARRASLKSLTPDERKGLWLALKKAELGRVGEEPADYQELERRALESPSPARPNRPLPAKAVGTIAYDTGPFSVSLAGNSLVGNRFDTHTGNPVVVSGSVSWVQAVVVRGPGTGMRKVALSDSAGFVMLGPQTTMGGAPFLFSSFTLVSGMTVTVTFTGLGVNYTGSSFFVLFGDFSSSYVPVLGTGTTLGQGHHGVVGYTGGATTSVVGTSTLGGTLNAFVRAAGNIVPVELMSFEID